MLYVNTKFDTVIFTFVKDFSLSFYVFCDNLLVKDIRENYNT